MRRFRIAGATPGARYVAAGQLVTIQENGVIRLTEDQERDLAKRGYALTRLDPESTPLDHAKQEAAANKAAADHAYAALLAPLSPSTRAKERNHGSS